MRRNTNEGGPTSAPQVVLDAVVIAASEEAAVMRERAADADDVATRAHESVAVAVEAEEDAEADAEAASAENGSTSAEVDAENLLSLIQAAFEVNAFADALESSSPKPGGEQI